MDTFVQHIDTEKKFEMSASILLELFKFVFCFGIIGINSIDMRI